jgi:hypothetical protein
MVTNINTNSPKYISAKNSLPKSLQPIYDQLVDEYAFHTTKHYGRGYVAYQVLANLVKDGWSPHEIIKD